MSNHLKRLFYEKIHKNHRKIKSLKARAFRVRNSKNDKKYDLLVCCPSCREFCTKWYISKCCYVCPFCKHHFPLPLIDRIKITFDEGSFQEMYQEITSTDFLHFKDVESYQKRIDKSPNNSAVIVGTATISNLPVNVALLDFSHIGGSLGSAMGEKLVRLIEDSIATRKPLMIFSSSGGCRMQEGLTSLMQMAKICAALDELNKKGVLYVSVLCHPTSGGVAASFSILGDINIAEPDTMICFAGPRVAELTIGEKMSRDLLLSNAVFKRGLLDCLIERKSLREELAKILLFFGTKRRVKKKAVKKNLSEYTFHSCDKPIQPFIEELEKLEEGAKSGDHAKQMKTLKQKIANMATTIHGNLTKLQILEISRSSNRIDTYSLVEHIFDDYIELHGDRLHFDDPAIVGGLGFLGQDRVVFVGHEKGRNLEEKMHCNFGMPHPEGFRKARRLFLLAEKFRLPIVTFVDTPGAYPGEEAAKRGQIEAIAGNLKAMSQLTVPIITFIVGQGGSGGALGIGLCNKLYMFEFSYYSVISPEGCSSILYKRKDNMEEVACNLQITAQENRKWNIVDEIIREPAWLLNTKWESVAQNMRTALKDDLGRYKKMSGECIRQERYQKYRKMGIYKTEK